MRISLLLGLLFRKYHRVITRMAIPKIPPTTPPAIVPTGVVCVVPMGKLDDVEVGDGVLLEVGNGVLLEVETVELCSSGVR
jgi:hypothetical protein